MRKDYILPIAIVVLIMLAQPKTASGSGEKSFLGQAGLPRGIRNNNPGNLKYTEIPWKGKVPFHQNTDESPEGKHEQFVNWYYGVRAMWKDITNDIEVDGDNTLDKLIRRYAVGNQGNYIDYVSMNAGISRHEDLRGRDLYPVIDYMARWENGREYGQIISREDYEKARTL